MNNETQKVEILSFFRKYIVFVLTGVVFFLGVYAPCLIWKPEPTLPLRIALIAGFFLFALAEAAFLIVPAVLFRRKRKEWEKVDVARMQEELQSHRERAEQMASEGLEKLRRLRRNTVLFTVLFGLTSFFLAMISALWIGTVVEPGSVGAYGTIPFELLGWYGIYSAVTRIRIPASKTVFRTDQNYVTEEEFPELYAMAKQAAAAVGMDREIRIALLPDCNAGIAQVGSVCSVQIGVQMLHLFSREEVYCVLLHEFSHTVGENASPFRESSYHFWLTSGRDLSLLPPLTDFVFRYVDICYLIQYLFFDYATRILIETEADRAMVQNGSPEATGSAMLKLKYYDLFQWESGVEDTECDHASETLPKDCILRMINDFRKALDQRKEFWDTLIPVEIQPRSATHPILRLRLEALGIADAKLMEYPFSESYRAECVRALSFAEENLYRLREPFYEEERKEAYLEPLKTVEKWEAAGKPVIAEEYHTVVPALLALGRVSEAIALCDRAIETLPEQAARYAHYQKGANLLYRYDPAGLEHLYIAMENQNFQENGMQLIGSYCCMVGNQEELDRYRELAPKMGQKHLDHYSQLSSLTRKDRLSAETLPEGMEEKILDYLKSVDPGILEEVYLIRKTVDEDFFFTAVVLRVDPKSDPEKRVELFEKAFGFLDTFDEWQFSLFEYFGVRPAVNSVKDCRIYKKQ